MTKRWRIQETTLAESRVEVSQQPGRERGS